VANTPPDPELGGLAEATSPMKKVSVEPIARVRRIIRIRLKRLVRIFVSLKATTFVVKAYARIQGEMAVSMTDEPPRLLHRSQNSDGHRGSPEA